MARFRTLTKNIILLLLLRFNLRISFFTNPQPILLSLVMFLQYPNLVQREIYFILLQPLPTSSFRADGALALVSHFLNILFVFESSTFDVLLASCLRQLLHLIAPSLTLSSFRCRLGTVQHDPGDAPRRPSPFPGPPAQRGRTHNTQEAAEPRQGERGATEPAQRAALQSENVSALRVLK